MPHRTHDADRAGASSLAAPTVLGGTPKHRADSLLFGSRPKKPRNMAVGTKRLEAIAKAAQFQRALKRLPLASW